MVNIKAQVLRDCDDDELEQRLVNARKELFNLRFQVATGRLDNVARIGLVRREVARVLTVQRDREIAAAEAVAADDIPAVIATRPTRRVSALALTAKRKARRAESTGPEAEMPEDEFSDEELEEELPEDEIEDELGDGELEDELEDNEPDEDEPEDELDDELAEDELEDELPEDEMPEDEMLEEETTEDN